MKLLNKKVADFKLSADSDLSFLLPRHLMHEFDYARTLEKGVIAETEPEFNHQYRVTLRRIRSILLLLKANFCPFEFKLLKPHLKLLMKQTNTLRDLDVFLIDSDVHQLRIECKKLRYLLEYFTPLYVPNQGHLGIQHRANVKQLKQLQDRLGAFNDTSNQLDFFRKQQNDKLFTKPQRKAIGQLLTLVEKDHQSAKLAIFADLKTFKREIKRSDALTIYA